MRILLLCVLLSCGYIGQINASFADTLGDVPEKLVVYTPSQALYVHHDEKGDVVGPMAQKTRWFLDQTGLEYEIIIAPWQRAYMATLRRNNVGVVNIDRIPAREDLFHWIIPVNTRRNVLLARNEDPFVGMDAHAAVNSDGLAVCVRNSSQCDMLRDVGFRQERIWEVDSENFEVVDLLLSGRVDFFIYDFDNLMVEVDLNQKDASRILPLFEVNEMTSYFAVSKAIHPDILKVLHSTATKVMEQVSEENIDNN